MKLQCMWESLEKENKGLWRKATCCRFLYFHLQFVVGQKESSAVQCLQSIFADLYLTLCPRCCVLTSGLLWQCDSKVCALVSLKLQRSCISGSPWINKLISSSQQICIVRCQWYSAIPLPPYCLLSCIPKHPPLEGQSAMQLLFTSDPLNSDSLSSAQQLTLWSAFTGFSKQFEPEMLGWYVWFEIKVKTVLLLSTKYFTVYF